MTRMLTKVFPLVALAVVSACSGSSGSRADLVFKQVDCANQAGIEGQFTTQIVRKDGKHTEVFVPGNGVSEAQAAQANACVTA
ncbi:hypothetical protein NBRC116589_15400 [Ruegeria sp. HU-ET01832]|uniref:hypothetical protein n=1 Tax=Ruegeria sp. HU-ET01832 TaxID=3135906 RepID=UPI0031027933